MLSMQLFLIFLLKPLKMEYFIKFTSMKTIVIIFCMLWLMVATAESIALGIQQPSLNYKQQLQYQMQQHDKYEYQQHIKQQQQYYQQQYNQQQQLTPTAMALYQQQEPQQQRQQHQPSSSYLAAKPTQMLQTAASLIVDDDRQHQSEALALGQPEYSNANSQRRRPANRKRKRRPQPINSDVRSDGSVALNSAPYWQGQIDDDKEGLNMPAKQTVKQVSNTDEVIRPSLQASFKRRKQSTIREPLAALEKEQKLYEMRNKPETSNDSPPTNNRNSADLKNILKNSGGLSLSEILQQKNLSLDDLLKGKQNALQALQTTATAPMEKAGLTKYPSFKPNFKSNPSTLKVSEVGADIEDRSKLSALHRLKLFGSSSRPTGIQVGLGDHLTTRKRDGNLYSSTTTTKISTTTPRPSTTKIPLYKKILHQRPTLKPSFLLKNTAVIATAEPEKIVTSWDSKEQEQEMGNKAIDQDANDEVEEIQLEIETEIPETTTTSSKVDTTLMPTTTISSTTIISTLKTSSDKTSYRDLSSATRRMYTSTRGHGRTTYRFTTSTTTTPPPPTIDITTTALPITTTTTSTTTASSSTMNLTPKANLNLNTDDIRERIQETLLKNLIEKEDSFKKSLPNIGDNDDDLENFFEETVKPKNAKAYESSTITTRMKQFSPLFSTSSSVSIPSSTTQEPFTTSTENLNFIPDFDNVDDRTDLLELIEDRHSGNRLFKVLEQRNMTLEELIEHRKRGSSQLHLATIVESPSRFYPDKKVVLQDNMDIVTAFENFPHFNLLNLKSVKPDDIKTDSQGSSYFTSIIDIEPTDEVYKNRKGSSLTAAELDKASLLADRSEKSLGFFPSWKSLALASLATSTTTTSDNNNSNMRNNNRRVPFYLQQPKMLLESNNENEQNNDIDDVYDIKNNELLLISHDENEDDDNQMENENDYQNPIQAAVRLRDSSAEVIENEVARAHDLVELELSGHGFKRRPQAAGALAHSHRHGTFYANMPAGIKSAIVASATIVLTALITFMVIFAICRWKQRRHRMTNIMKSYNAMKSKMPATATTATLPAGITGLAALTASSTTNSNSRRSSFRDMHDFLGGSGLSVAATITTTSTGVPNSPLTTTKTLGNSLTTPPLNASQSSTTTASLMSVSNCNKHKQQQQHHIYNQNANNNSCNSNSNNSKISSNSRPLQRQSSLLFQRNTNNSTSNSSSISNNDKPTNLAILSGCNLLDMKRNNKMNGSTTSLSFSLTSGHNISNTHINTMDANSPEVQEYLFDTLRNSF